MANYRRNACYMKRKLAKLFTVSSNRAFPSKKTSINKLYHFWNRFSSKVNISKASEISADGVRLLLTENALAETNVQPWAAILYRSKLKSVTSGDFFPKY